MAVRVFERLVRDVRGNHRLTLVLELVDGDTLADKLANVSRQRPGLPMRDALNIAGQIRRVARTTASIVVMENVVEEVKRRVRRPGQ